MELRAGGRAGADAVHLRVVGIWLGLEGMGLIDLWGKSIDRTGAGVGPGAAGPFLLPTLG